MGVISWIRAELDGQGTPFEVVHHERTLTSRQLAAEERVPSARPPPIAAAETARRSQASRSAARNISP